MNVLRKPLYSSLIIFLIWAIVIMRVQDLPFVVHHRPLDQFEGKSIDFLELIFNDLFFRSCYLFEMVASSWVERPRK